MVHNLRMPCLLNIYVLRNKIHPFDALCKDHKIELRLTQFKHPWTNGQVQVTNKILKKYTTKAYRQERFCVFGIACGNTSPPFKMKECIFNKMFVFIEIFIVDSLRFSVLTRRDDDLHALFFCLINNKITIISLIWKRCLDTSPRLTLKPARNQLWYHL